MENKETLASALCKAQSEFTPAAQSGYNPHFKSSFSTMTDLIRATRPALKKYGLAVLQYPYIKDGITVLRTEIMCSDVPVGMFSISLSDYPIVLKDPSDMQAFGKACSYITRYVYKMMLGIEAADECEDDGNASAGIGNVHHLSSKSPVTIGGDAISDKQLVLLKMMLKDQPNREAALLSHYKIDDLSKLPWRHMNEVVAALKPKE